MEEGLKSRLILILCILTAIFFVVAVSSCSKTGQLKSIRDKEMSLRLDAEKEKEDIAKERDALKEKLKKSEEALAEEKTGLDTAKKTLVQEQLINMSLKEELQKVSKLKDALEEDLKEALATKASKGKK